MTTPTVASPERPSAGASRPGVRPYRFPDVLRSEWIKVRTVRSTLITLVATVIVSTGLGALIAFGVGRHYKDAGLSDRLTFDPTAVSFYSLLFGQLVISVLAVLVVSSEYSTGMIRPSLQAVPRRTWFLGAKALVFAVIALVAGEVVSFANYFVVQPILKSGPAPYSTLGQPHVLRAVIGAGLYLTVIGLLSLGIAALIRHTAGAITTAVALYFVVPAVSNALPSNWQHDIQRWLPSQAGSQVFSTLHLSHEFSAWIGFMVLCIYTAVVLIAAAVVLNRRDA